MTDITADRLNEIAALASELPDEFRVAAFTELVRHELGTNDVASSPGSTAGPGKSTTPSPALDGEMPELSAIKKMDGNAKVGWAIVELAARDEIANAESIGKLIKDELGASAPANMSRTLKNLTPEYANRTKHGPGYKYTPTKETMSLLKRKDDGK